MREIDAASNNTPGSRRMLHDLALKHVRAGRHTVRRMMHADDMRAKRTPRRRGVQTTDSTHTLPVAENLLTRNFTATSLNETWSCDITHVRTLQAFVNLAIVMDLFSRRVIGWHVSERIDEQLTIMALWKAWKHRKTPTGMIIHSFRGLEYASNRYRALSRSSARLGRAESKGQLLEQCFCQVVLFNAQDRRLCIERFPDVDHVRYQATRFTNHVVNQTRLQSTFGYQSPIQFDGAYIRQQQLTNTVV
jgi:transposase InsO family protein